MSRVQLLALLVADHVYCDQGSNKYIIAGTFHQLNIASFPAIFHKTVGVFIKLAGFAGAAALTVVFEDLHSGDVVMRTHALEVPHHDPDRPFELALEVPPLRLPHPGRYAFKLLVDSEVVGTSTIDVLALAGAGPGH